MSNNNNNFSNLPPCGPLPQFVSILPVPNVSTFTQLTVQANPATGEAVSKAAGGMIPVAKRESIPPVAAAASLSSAAIPIPVKKEKDEQDVKGQMSNIRLPREKMLDEVLPIVVSDIISDYANSLDPSDLFKEFYSDMKTLKNLTEEEKKKLWVDFAKKTQPNCFKPDEVLHNNLEQICFKADELLKDGLENIISRIGKVFTKHTDEVIFYTRVGYIAHIYKSKGDKIGQAVGILANAVRAAFQSNLKADPELIIHFLCKRYCEQDLKCDQETTDAIIRSVQLVLREARHLPNRNFHNTIAAEELIRRPDNHCMLELVKEVHLSKIPGMTFVFPNLLKECRNLEILGLSGIRIHSPLEIFKFKKLNTLLMSNCKLSSIDNYFDELTGLKVADFTGNQLESVPEALIQKIKSGQMDKVELQRNLLPKEEKEKIREAEIIGNTKRIDPMQLSL